MKPEVRTELQSLLAAACDGRPTPADADRLRRLLAQDADARRAYRAYVDAGGKAGSAGGSFVGYLAVAAATAAVLLAVYFWPRESAPVQLRTHTGGPAEAVATLTQAANCEWDGPAESRRAGARLVPGRLTLKAGVAELRLDGGPDVVLEGPATLRLERQNSATLVSGKAVVRSAANSPPFNLRTPGALLVDNDAEYGVRAGPQGEELHVYSGEVARTGDSATESIKAGTAMRYDLLGAGTPMPSEPTAFARSVAQPSATAAPATPASTGPVLLAYEGFDYADADALAAGKADGGSGWAGPWQMAFARPLPPTATPKLFAATGLTRAGATTPGAGGAFEFTGFTKLFRRLKTPIRLDRDEVYYLSYLFRRDGQATDPTNAVAVLLWTSEDQKDQGTNPDTRLNIGVGGAGHELFTHLHGIGSRTPLPLSYDEPYLMVAKIVASAARPDQVFLRVYSPGESVAPAETGIWTVVGRPYESSLTFDWLQAHINSSARQTLDEIRVGTTWAAVTAAWVPAGK